MPDFGFHEGFRRRHHRHHPYWPSEALDLDPIASAMDPDIGCDPMSPGFRVFGDDGDGGGSGQPVDDGTPEDDGSGGQGGVLDAVTQVASGVADVIAPAVAPVYYDPRYPHHHRHHRFVPPPMDRYEAERAAHFRRLEFERHHGYGTYPYARDHHRFYGEFGYVAPPTGQIGPVGILPPPVSMNPMQRYGQNGYRPRGQRFGQHHDHHHHGHHPHYGQGGRGGYPQQYGQGNQNLPPGSYMQTCSGCTYDGNTLSCQCANMQGQYQPTSAQVQPGMSMSNQNGNLTPGM